MYGTINLSSRYVAEKACFVCMLQGEYDMSKTLKIIVGIILALFIASGAALIIPPFA